MFNFKLLKTIKPRKILTILILASLGGLLTKNLDRVFAQDSSVSCSKRKVNNYGN
jgi:hypothetical protein